MHLTLTKREGNWAELIFAKTSGPVTGQGKQIGHFRVPPVLCIKTRLSAQPHANKTHFHKKGCALGLILKVRVFGTRKWPIGQ